MKSIYCDYAASSPTDPRVVKAMQQYWSLSGNASAIHAHGRAAMAVVDAARQTVARVLHTHSDDIIFTSGATESNNMVLQGIVASRVASCQPVHIVTTPIEHASVREVVWWLHKRYGVAVTELPVSSNGLVDPAAVVAAIRPETVLVSIGWANNEFGVIQPIAEIGARTHELNKTRPTPVYFHTDATQAIAQLPIDITACHVDFLSCSAHKFYGPAGVGVLVARSRGALQPLMQGGGHQFGLRSGTLPVALIHGLAVAMDLAAERRESLVTHVTALRDQLESGLRQRHPDLVVFGTDAPRLGNISCIAVPGHNSSDALILLDQQGISVSTGAACSAGAAKKSYALEALGGDKQLATNGLRFSFGWGSKSKDVVVTLKLWSYAANILKKSVNNL